MHNQPTRMFDGEAYKYYASYITKRRAEAAKERLEFEHLDGHARLRFRIVKRVYRSPPQGEILYDLYYRRYGHEVNYRKKTSRKKGGKR